MILTQKPLREMADPSAVKALYEAAFPKEERLPWFCLRLLEACRRLRIDCYLVDDAFCGFTVAARTEQVMYVLFFAVAEEMRGRGWGSAILQLLRHNQAGKPLGLCVEPPEEGARNAAQRVERLRFYEHNGLVQTGYEIDEVGGTFLFLSDGEMDVPAYQNLFRKLSLGLWRPPIRRIEHG